MIFEMERREVEARSPGVGSLLRRRTKVLRIPTVMVLKEPSLESEQLDW